MFCENQWWRLFSGVKMLVSGRVLQSSILSGNCSWFLGFQVDGNKWQRLFSRYLKSSDFVPPKPGSFIGLFGLSFCQRPHVFGRRSVVLELYIETNRKPTKDQWWNQNYGLSWIYPPPRMPATTKSTFLVGDPSHWCLVGGCLALDSLGPCLLSEHEYVWKLHGTCDIYHDLDLLWRCLGKSTKNS